MFIYYIYIYISHTSPNKLLSAEKPLQKTTTYQNAKNKKYWGSHSHIVYLQHNSYP